MPVAVKQRFAHRPGLATGIYASGIQVGSTAAAGLAVPLAHAHGGWRFSLGVFSVATALLVPGWLLASRGSSRTAVVSRPKMPWRSATAWRLVLVFSLVAFNFYGISHWLADSYVERGWSESHAGWLLTAFQAATVPSGLLVPWLADRMGSRRFYLFVSAALMAGAMLGVILAHGGAFAWAVLLGTGMGVLFAMAMTLPLDVSDDPAEAGAAAGMMLGVGYSLVSVSPFLLGAIRDATGSFTDSLWVLFAVSATLTLVATTITHERLHRGLGTAGRGEGQ
jgi:CP family cyanate transporter-like MFS transporter